MRILTTITYYTPHISGLTVYARRVIRRLVERGHEVTVLTSRFDPRLPARETIDGATVIRSPVLFRVSKGAFAPRFLWDAARLVPKHDIVYLHLPQFEASGVAVIAKTMRKPLVTTYQCDIELPPGIVRVLFTPAIRVSHYITGKLSDRLVVLSDEYGRSARLPAHFHQKVLSVYPPIELAAAEVGPAEFRRRHNLGDGPLVGFVGRYAEEKGLDHLLAAVPLVQREIPNARCVLAGPTDTVPGERVHEWLQPKIDALRAAVVHLGLLSDPDLTSFYQAIDVLVLPSTNSTEAFGMTQAEAMLAGTPVVASDIPGVREAVRITGMGLVVPPRAPEAIARAIVTVLRTPERFVRPIEEIRDLFDPARTAAFYEQLFAGLIGQPQQLSDAELLGEPPDEAAAERKQPSR